MQKRQLDLKYSLNEKYYCMIANKDFLTFMGTGPGLHLDLRVDLCYKLGRQIKLWPMLPNEHKVF